MLAWGRLWRQMDTATQDILIKHFDTAAPKTRASAVKLDRTSEVSPKAKGMSSTELT